jgi:hypothetical protein
MAGNLGKNAFFAETIKRWQKNCICAEPGFPSYSSDMLLQLRFLLLHRQMLEQGEFFACACVFVCVYKHAPNKIIEIF